MKVLIFQLIWLVGSTAGFTAASAAERPAGFWVTPTIEAAGRMHALPDAAYRPEKKQTYRVVFAVTRGTDKPAAVNASLDRVARTVNLYVDAGVPLRQLKFVAVLSGPATNAALDDDHYKQLFGIENPNLPLIQKLRAAGVDVAVCGQAVAESDYEFDWVSKQITLALSALTTVTTLQSKGYALMPL
jgi:intracellular sulfur oxidation DsrE/DsrF family protein